MISRGVIIFTLCTTPIAWAQQTETIVQQSAFVVPAGTLLACTLDEPNFSSQTARPGDPILCKTSSLQMFGRQLIPRGAYLSAHFKDYRDPGHFWGKGWLQLEFTNLTLPGGSVPLEAKVISAARYRVNGDGKIQGKGHPTRDAIEWSIPILWPVKVLTLPARGPRPTFKAETSIEVRVMEDIVIPESAYGNSRGLTRSSSILPGRDDANGFVAISPVQSFPAQRRLTVLVLRGGTVYFVADYWVENRNLDYTTGEGAQRALPLDALDVPTTKQINAERGMTFVLTSKRH